jgi:hypothetical protein
MHVFAYWHDYVGLRFWFVDDYRSDFLVALASASMTEDRAQ